MRFVSLAFFFVFFALSCSSPKVDKIVAPNDPTHLESTLITNREIDLRWDDNSSNETGFNVERRTANDNYTIIGSISAGQTFYLDTGLIANKQYFYRVYSFNAAGSSKSSNEISCTTNGKPTVNTATPSLITTFSAQLGGNVTSDGGSQITSQGVIWDTNPNPNTSLSTKSADLSSSSTFATKIEGLNGGTTYYARAFAINQYGTGYGNEMSFTTAPAPVTAVDGDGNIYHGISIGTQYWLRENLHTTKFNNGEAIPQIIDDPSWVNSTIGAWCYYNNDSKYDATYGKLYNWFTVTDSRNVCPVGWHVPSQEEWQTMITFLGGNNVAGGKLKESGLLHWESPNTGATNSSNFTGLPGGLRQDPNPPWTFDWLGERGFWWTSESSVKAVELNYGGNGVSDGNSIWIGFGTPRWGVSIRCIKN